MRSINFILVDRYFFDDSGVGWIAKPTIQVRRLIHPAFSLFFQLDIEVTRMKKWVLSSCLLILTQVSMAGDYLLDASTMAVGATAGENLVVKEGCLKLSETSCTEKYKWLTAVSLIKIGNLQVLAQLSGNFEIVVTADFDSLIKGIKILTADNKGFGLSFSEGGTWGSYGFTPNGLGTGGANYGDRLPGWSKSNFNEVKITVQQGVANVYTNGAPLNGGAITFDAGVVFERVAIEGITGNDRISDVKVRGIQTACTGSSTPVSGGTTAPLDSSQLPTIAPNLNMHIPTLEYQTLGGKMNLWVDLQFTPTDDGEIWWTLENYGVNP